MKLGPNYEIYVRAPEVRVDVSVRDGEVVEVDHQMLDYLIGWRASRAMKRLIKLGTIVVIIERN